MLEWGAFAHIIWNSSLVLTILHACYHRKGRFHGFQPESHGLSAVPLSESEMLGFPGGSVVKNLPASEGDTGPIPGLGRSPGESNGSPFQYSCLENFMDRGAWRATVHGVAKSRETTEQLNNNKD